MTQAISELEKMGDELVKKELINEAKKLLGEVWGLFASIRNKIQKRLNAQNKLIHITYDAYIAWLNLETDIKLILEKIRLKYGTYALDEVAVLKIDGSMTTPICFYTINSEKSDAIEKKTISISEIREELEENIKFFIDHIVSKWLLFDNEWTIAGNGAGEAFDLVYRAWDYIIWFNNSDESTDSLKEKYNINSNDLIKDISKIYHTFK